jgi:hypothetical protein
MRRYITDPQEVYTLELEKFQRCFSELARTGEGISELNATHWRQVEQLRQFNFILQEAIQIGEILTSAL